MSKALEIMDAARAFVQGNLPEMARELLEWRDTGILTNGRVRECANFLRDISRSDALSIAEKLARDAALEIIAR